MGKIIVIASGKGGVGKTTLAVNLGVSMAAMGKKVLIADMNLGFRNDDIYLGLEDRILFDMGDVASGVCKLEKAIVSSDICDNLYLISCPQNREIEGMTVSHIKALYSRFRNNYDVVLVDIPICSGSQAAIFSCDADASLVVVSHDFSSVRNGDSVNRRFISDGINERYFVINLISQSNFGNKLLPEIDYIGKTIDAKCVGLIPFDQSIHIANNSGTPAACTENSYIADLFKKIAAEIL